MRSMAALNMSLNSSKSRHPDASLSTFANKAADHSTRSILILFGRALSSSRRGMTSSISIEVSSSSSILALNASLMVSSRLSACLRISCSADICSALR